MCQPLIFVKKQYLFDHSDTAQQTALFYCGLEVLITLGHAVGIIPVSDLRLEDEAVRVAVGTRIGLGTCELYTG